MRYDAAAEPFARAALDVVPRVLGLCDRDPASSSVGCCDRYHWHYKFLDFPNARFQEAGLLFALAFADATPSNPFAGRQSLAQWARDAWSFWLGARNSDGSVAEAYPHERSFCATAFCAAAFVETAGMLGVGDESWRPALKQARNTFVWLGEHENAEVANQMAASYQALVGYQKLVDDPAIARLRVQRRERLLALAGTNGDFPEYGGWDAGYQSITLSSIARSLDVGGPDDDLRDVLRKGVELLEQRIDAEGGVDPRSNSRSTQYVYPHALAWVGSKAIDRLVAGLRSQRLLQPSWLDDRYCIAMAIDYFFAAKRLAAP